MDDKDQGELFGTQDIQSKIQKIGPWVSLVYHGSWIGFIVVALSFIWSMYEKVTSGEIAMFGPAPAILDKYLPKEGITIEDLPAPIPKDPFADLLRDWMLRR
jgi:hypothetical protein